MNSKSMVIIITIISIFYISVISVLLRINIGIYLFLLLNSFMPYICQIHRKNIFKWYFFIYCFFVLFTTLFINYFILFLVIYLLLSIFILTNKNESKNN